MATDGSQIVEDKIWNAYIDEYGKEPSTMSQLHNFAKGPNNPHGKISFKAIAKIYPRNQSKGKVAINDNIKHNKQAANTQEIALLKKENEQLKKQINELLVKIKSNTNNDDTKEEQKEAPSKPQNTLQFKSEFNLWSAIDNKIKSGDEDFIRQLLNQGLVTVNSVRKSGAKRSMLQIASINGQYRIAQMLLNLGADVNYKCRFPKKDSLQFAQSNGHYHVEKLLMLSKMDASASDQINDIATKLNTQKGIMNYLYQAAEAKQNGEVVFDGIVDLMIDIIHKRRAFSDDILNLALDYSINKAVKSTHAGEGNEDDNKADKDTNEEIDRDTVVSTDLWQCIYNTCVEIITNKKHDKLEWFWLKTYLLSSTIWLRQFKDKRNNNENNSLYFELLDIVGAQALAQIDVYLKHPFKKIAEANISEWNTLCAFDVDINHKEAIRQDTIANGHKAQYTRDILGKKCVSIDPFNAFNHYDTRQYLSALVLTAQMVNSEFHKSIIKIFAIDMKTLVGKFSAVYKEGPVKLLSRCQAKAEVDYKNEPFPTSAHVLDINRCSLIFEDIGSMLNGLKLFDDAVKDYTKNEICITEIIRCKNGWKEYNHESPTYADIKFNVVIEGEYHSIIGEVQFLLRSMMEFKGKQHPLYSIERKKEFITAMADILPFLTDIPKTLNVNATLGNVNGICDAIVTQHLNVEEIVTNQYKNNIFDILCISGHIRALKFLMDIMPDNLLTERLRNKDDFNRPFLSTVAETGKRQVLQLLFKQKCIRECIDDNMWEHILEAMLRNCDCETVRIILTIDNVYKNIPKKGWHKAIGNSLCYGKKNFFELFTSLCDINTVKELIIEENYLQTAVTTNWDEFRLELTQSIIDFTDFKQMVKDQHIADALYTAVRKNDCNVFKLICEALITAKEDKIERFILLPHSDTKMTALQCACKEGDRSDFIELLLSNVTDANIAKYVNYKGGESTAIAFAAKAGETRILDRFLEVAGIDVFGENEDKSSCSITEALKRGNIAIAEKLYSKLSDAQKQYKYDSKLLWETVVSTITKSDTAALKFVIGKLMKNATDVLVNCDAKKGSLITIATDSKQDATNKVKYLCSVLPNDAVKDLINYQTEKRRECAVRNAIDKSNIDLLKYFATIPGVDFQQLGVNKKTLFANAVWSCKFAIAELLFMQYETQEDKLRALKSLDSGGNCVFVEITGGKQQLVELVLKHMDFNKIDVNVLNDESEFGDNTMNWCAKIGVMEFVDALLQIKGVAIKSDAILKAITVDLYSCGELAIGQKLYEHLRNLGQETFDFSKDELFDIFRGLSHKRVDDKKSIAIMEFIVSTLINNEQKVSELLLMKGDANNIYSANILLTTMRHKQSKVCQYIMSLIANDKVIDEINYQDECGNSILQYAAQHGSVELFEHIAKEYKDVNMVQCNSQTGDTSFHVAARFGYVDMCRLILAQCANNEQRLSVINLKNKKNETPLMVAKNKAVQIAIQKWKSEFSE